MTEKDKDRFGREMEQLVRSHSQFQVWLSKARKRMKKFKAFVSAKFSSSMEESFKEFWNQIEEKEADPVMKVYYFQDSCVIRMERGH